jgi:hypothetical protein
MNLKKIIVSCIPLLLTACGGGGGGGGGTSSTLAPFIKWSALAAGTTYEISGDSAQGTYVWDSATDRVTSFTLGAQQDGAKFTETFDSNGIIQSVRIQTAAGTDISFQRGVDTFGVLVINNNINAVISSDGTKYVLAPEPRAMGWEYQAYGIWVTGAGTGSGTYGAASVGAQTPVGSMPSTGVAFYQGNAAGRYVDAGGNYYFAAADMLALTDFSARSLQFSTTNTSIVTNLSPGTTPTPAPNLDLGGTLTYTAGSNQFTGNVTSFTGMVGTATGRFFGPSAEEIGGTFGVTGAGTEVYGGGFGGKR